MSQWQTQSVLQDCRSCQQPILPGEPVRILKDGVTRWCWLCARKRLMETAPQECPPQPVPRVYVSGEARFVEPIAARFPRPAVSVELRKNILGRRALDRANARDPKLRQLGGDQ